MNESTEFFLKRVSQYCYVSKIPYSFSNHDVNKQYAKGLIKVYSWVDELCFYYIQKDKQIQNDFRNIVLSHYDEAKDMKDSPYKEGLICAFENIKKFIEKS